MIKVVFEDDFLETWRRYDNKEKKREEKQLPPAATTNFNKFMKENEKGRLV